MNQGNTTITKKWVTERLPKRPKDANKGTFGKVMVIAGSENYPGAAYLVCAACYKAGAGLVTLVTKLSVKTIISKKLPEVTFLLENEALGKAGEYDVLLIGPGLGQDKQAVKLVERMLIDDNLPKTIIDGDGLNIISKAGEWWKSFDRGVILTPHPGEMARLTGLSLQEIQSNRIDVAQYYAKKWNKFLVLKGANTLVVSPAGQTAISPYANPILATAGTGDILSGVITGLLAQGLGLFDAAAVGVYIHGMAAEMVSREIGDSGMMASDLLPMLPKAIKKLKTN